MEVTLGCNSATVSILDAGYAEVVTFEGVPVIGATGYCADEQFAAFDGFGSGGDGSRVN
jgi:hypothetical protein